MKNTFVERATTYPLDYGELVVYESNRQCDSIPFTFDHHVMTIMMAGQKSILTHEKRFEFFPGTFFIPQKDILFNVGIPVASRENPTKCLELDLEPKHIRSFYDEFLSWEGGKEIVYSKEDEVVKEYLSNDGNIISLFERIYYRRLEKDTIANRMIINLMIKQLLVELFQTSALHLLLDDLNMLPISKPMQTVLKHIKSNISKKLSAKELAEIAGMGLTSFFNKFKSELEMSPKDYITKARLEHAKSYLRNGGYSLKEAAFSSGFKSYEHFCSTFKKAEEQTPSEFLRSI